MELSELDRQLLDVVAAGIPLTSRPFDRIAADLGVTEDEIGYRLSRLVATGVVRRFGLVVRHHELGYRANAMAVWDVPDDRIDAVGEAMAAHSFVTLCYRRPRRLPLWPFNLFCMIHGREREAVRSQIDEMTMVLGIGDMPREILFSRRRFKQRGARYRQSSLASTVSA
jgi:DNA-binding Lrp family transcriptional regulator